MVGLKNDGIMRGDLFSFWEWSYSRKEIPVKVPQIHQCQCEVCQSREDHPDQAAHHQINVFMSRLDEQQRRWYAALEALRMGHGGIVKMSEITGLSERTIRRGKGELEQDLQARPPGRIRLPGAGRPRVEKKTAGSRAGSSRPG